MAGALSPRRILGFNKRIERDGEMERQRRRKGKCEREGFETQPRVYELLISPSFLIGSMLINEAETDTYPINLT